MLKKKDVFLLNIMEKVTLASTWQLMILGGYRDPSVVRKRIKKLREMGYIVSDWLGDHLVHTLTQGGLSELEKTRRPYDIRGIKSEHEELVTEAACWIYIRSKRGIFDMLFDHEMNSLSEFKGAGGHRPDIAFSKHSAVEVELSSKQTKGTGKKHGLEDNFISNARQYYSQVWFVPEYKKGLINRLRELARKHVEEKRFLIITVEEMRQVVKNYDPARNSPRTEPLYGTPAPLVQKEREIELQ